VWEAHLTCNLSVINSISIKGSHCFLEQATLTSLLSTGSFQELIRTWCHNGKKDESRALRKNTECQISPLVKYLQDRNQMFLFSPYRLMLVILVLWPVLEARQMFYHTTTSQAMISRLDVSLQQEDGSSLTESMVTFQQLSQ